MTRKLFYVFDMVLLGLLFFSLEHTLIRENVVIDTMLDFALVLRIIIPFLLYRYDRHAIWPVLLFTALFGWTFYSNVFYNTIMNMSGFPSIVFGTGPTFERYVVSARDSAGIIIMYGLIYWIWLMPVVVYAIQIACKLTKKQWLSLVLFHRRYLIQRSSRKDVPAYVIHAGHCLPDRL